MNCEDCKKEFVKRKCVYGNCFETRFIDSAIKPKTNEIVLCAVMLENLDVIDYRCGSYSDDFGWNLDIRLDKGEEVIAWAKINKLNIDYANEDLNKVIYLLAYTSILFNVLSLIMMLYSLYLFFTQRVITSYFAILISISIYLIHKAFEYKCCELESKVIDFE